MLPANKSLTTSLPATLLAYMYCVRLRVLLLCKLSVSPQSCHRSVHSRSCLLCTVPSSHFNVWATLPVSLRVSEPRHFGFAPGMEFVKGFEKHAYLLFVVGW